MAHHDSVVAEPNVTRCESAQQVTRRIFVPSSPGCLKKSFGRWLAVSTLAARRIDLLHLQLGYSSGRWRPALRGSSRPPGSLFEGNRRVIFRNR